MYVCIYVYIYIWPYMYLCVHRYSFHIWGKACGLWLFEPGFLCLTWCSLVLSIYQHTTLFHSSLWSNNFIVFIFYIFLIHSSVMGCLSCLQSLDIVNNVAINMNVHVSLLYHYLYSFRYISRRGKHGSYGSSIFSFLGLSILFP
jgi:hypothetical protein